MNNEILIIVTLFILTVTIIVIVLNFLQNNKNKKLQRFLDKLEIQKNVIDSTPIVPELAKIESFLKNDKLEDMYNSWKDRHSQIKNEQVPKLTDMLIDTEYSLSQADYKSFLYKIAKLEMEIYKVKTNSDFLLEEIKQITTSEEKNRAIITGFKSRYRDLYQKYNEASAEYGEIKKSVKLQFENIAKRFEDFEIMMENNEYTEVTKIIKAIDDMLKHMDVVTEEVPAIVLTSTSILPRKIKEIEDIYKKMTREGYPLDYLNVEYNISEANKKINDIMDRCKVLNLEDSLFELKVLIEYFEHLFTDFEREKLDKASYEELNNGFSEKLNKIKNLIKDIFDQIDDIKNVYNLSKQDIVLLNEVNEEIKILDEDYKTLIGHTSNNTFAYSKLLKETENLVLRLSQIEDRIDNSLDAIGSMREDEVRARQQLEEIKGILKEAKIKIREYNLPLIPKSYFTELNEAQLAIKEIVKELEKKPITISVLNTRVDTARDLVLKLYSGTKELVKTAMFAEMAIVYGNRYRTNTEELDKNLTYSEVMFYKGEYQKSLELSINSLNKIEPGIYNKLLDLYGN